MKKILSVILMLLLAFSLVACGESCNDNTPSDEDGDVDFPLVEYQPK